MGNMGGMNGGFNNFNGGGPSNNMNGGGAGAGRGNVGNPQGGYQNGGNFPQGTGTEEDAYFRKPVNPHRHQNKQRRARPSDYREL